MDGTTRLAPLRPCPMRTLLLLCGATVAAACTWWVRDSWIEVWLLLLATGLGLHCAFQLLRRVRNARRAGRPCWRMLASLALLAGWWVWLIPGSGAWGLGAYVSYLVSRRELQAMVEEIRRTSVDNGDRPVSDARWARGRLTWWRSDSGLVICFANAPGLLGDFEALIWVESGSIERLGVGRKANRAVRVAERWFAAFVSDEG